MSMTAANDPGFDAYPLMTWGPAWLNAIMAQVISVMLKLLGTTVRRYTHS